MQFSQPSVLLDNVLCGRLHGFDVFGELCRIIPRRVLRLSFGLVAQHGILKLDRLLHDELFLAGVNLC